MSTLAAKITAPPIDLSTVIFEDEEDEYEVPSPILKSAYPPTPSARDALALIDLSSVIFDDDEEEYHYVSPPPPLTLSTSPCSTPSPPIPTSPTSSYSTLSSSADDSTHSPPPTKKKTRKFLEPTDRSMDFLWPEGIRPEYLRAPPHHHHPPAEEVTVEENDNSGIININGPLGQVVPFMPRKSNWAPEKPSPLRAVWTVEVEEEEKIPLAPLEKEIGNGAEPVDYWFL